MERFLTAVRSLFLLAAATTVHAETFQSIKAEATLGEVRAQFPSAQYEKLKPAWVKADDAFYRLTGVGFPGTLYLAFKDNRPAYKESAAAASTDQQKLFWANLLEGSEDESTWLKWMRWVPPAPIPVARYIAKYGKPEKSGFADDDMQPFSSWASKGIQVNLSDDLKNVLSVEFQFTKAEVIAACKGRNPKDTWQLLCTR